mmetsp:Transcript_10275/g.15521  ORF Transcript_10275/g.15521 Transcript_10275/m.15521 type:complete len:209 (-) Transcript_10275:655-1281(-)
MLPPSLEHLLPLLLHQQPPPRLLLLLGRHLPPQLPLPLVTALLHPPLPNPSLPRRELIFPLSLELDPMDVSLLEMLKLLPLVPPVRRLPLLLPLPSLPGLLLLELLLPHLWPVLLPRRPDLILPPSRELENSDVSLLMMFRLPLERRRLSARRPPPLVLRLLSFLKDLYLSLECSAPSVTIWRPPFPPLYSVSAARLRWMPSMLFTRV